MSVTRLRFAIPPGSRGVVEQGAQVLTGSTLIDAQRADSADVISSCAGTVAYADARWIEVEPDGTATQIDPVPVDPGSRLACTERLRAFGVIGMGGAGFPTFRKWQALPDSVALLMINAVECDRWLKSDQALLREQSPRVARAIETLVRALNPDRVVMATGPSTDIAGSDLDSAIERHRTDGSPASGWEPALLRSAGVDLRGQPPAAAGVLSLNVATCVVAAEALNGLPARDRLVTVEGETVVCARFGTPVGTLLEGEHQELIGGGASGIPVSWTAPVTASMAGIRSHRQPPELPCIRCGDCRPKCPVSIRPDAAYLAIAAGLSGTTPTTVVDEIAACVGCGACDTACPSDLPLTEVIVAGQRDLQLRRAANNRATRADERYSARKLRLERQSESASEARDHRLARLRSRRRG